MRVGVWGCLKLGMCPVKGARPLPRAAHASAVLASRASGARGLAFFSRDRARRAAFLREPTPTAMNFFSSPLLARLLWAMPLLLLVIAAVLVQRGMEQRETAEYGTGVSARVLDVEVRERSEITHGMVKLRYTPPEAAAPVERYIELPLAFMKEIEGDFAEDSLLTLPIRVRAGSDQIILDAFSRVQWVMTFAFAAMAAVGAIGLGVMVRAWNRLLRTEGDPADREPHDVPLA